MSLVLIGYFLVLLPANNALMDLNIFRFVFRHVNLRVIKPILLILQLERVLEIVRQRDANADGGM